MVFKQIQLLKHIESNPDIPVHFNDKGAIMKGITDINSTLYITLTLRSLIYRDLVEVIDDSKVRITQKGIESLNKVDAVAIYMQKTKEESKCSE